MLEMTGTIPPTQRNVDDNLEEVKNEQVLDTLKVERERGITVRAQSASLVSVRLLFIFYFWFLTRPLE